MQKNDFMSFMKKIPLDDLILGIGDVAQITAVSQSQLRYWERKGYIHSVDNPDGGNRKFTYKTVMQVKQIKAFMDDGYTLVSAVKRARERGIYVELLRSFFEQRFDGVEITDDGAEIELGVFDPEPTKRIIAVQQDQHWRFKLIDAD